jgi:hypothetical protein
MLSKTPIARWVYNYARGQDPSRRYNWDDNGECFCALFLTEEMGLTKEEAKDAHRAQSYPLMHAASCYRPDAMEVWRLFNIIAYGDADDDGMAIISDRTFGAVADRIAAKYPEFV